MTLHPRSILSILPHMLQAVCLQQGLNRLIRLNLFVTNPLQLKNTVMTLVPSETLP